MIKKKSTKRKSTKKRYTDRVGAKKSRTIISYFTPDSFSEEEGRKIVREMVAQMQ